MAGAQEIERKFLVDAVPELAWEREQAIRQGYVALDGETEVRVRLAATGATLTVKRGAGRARLEEELEVEPESAKRLWRLTEGRRVEKVRRVAALGGTAVEVDEYGGLLAGLVVAEVEFGSEEEADAFEPPAWFGREVTDDPAYGNRRLAVDGLPETVA